MNSNFNDLNSVAEMIIKTFKENLSLKELPCFEYSIMKYPKIIPFMKLNFQKYVVENFGNFSILKTKAMFSFMQLTTAVFTPSYGTEVPLLLIDIMKMGKKRAVFIEYYDLTAQKNEHKELSLIGEKYKNIKNYDETKAWYIKERTPYSLIKGGTGENDKELLNMLEDTVLAYSEVCKAKSLDSKNKEENLKILNSFVDRMVKEGNPSSSTLEKILGKDKAEEFFRNYVMPNKYEEVK